MFLLDMLVTLFTPYEFEDRLITSIRLIAWRYFKTTFLFDAVATFPTLFSN